MKYCYVSSFYFGSRRVFPQLYEEDRLLFLKKHLSKLKKLKHNISLAVFVINRADGLESIEKEAQELILQFKDIKTDIILRDNIDGSYGCWEDALKKHSEEFDYCFLIEDDYVPVSDNFDKKFQEHLKREKDIYACQLWWNEFGGYHAGISNGLIKCSAFREKGEFSLNRNVHSYGPAEHNQMNFLRNFTDDGWAVVDICKKYKNLFLNYQNNIVCYGNEKGEELIRPIHDKVGEC